MLKSRPSLAGQKLGHGLSRKAGTGGFSTTYSPETAQHYLHKAMVLIRFIHLKKTSKSGAFRWQVFRKRDWTYHPT